MILFLKLKSCHKSVHISNEQVFGELEIYKQKIDEFQLNLQSLQYESNHIQREISICKNFKSRHHQISNLIKQEEYKKISNDKEKDGKKRIFIKLLIFLLEHKLQLNVLNFELNERQKNFDKIKQLQEEELRIKKEIEEKKDQLNLFKESIKKLFVTSEPLQVFQTNQKFFFKIITKNRKF